MERETRRDSKTSLLANTLLVGLSDSGRRGTQTKLYRRAVSSEDVDSYRTPFLPGPTLKKKGLLPHPDLWGALG